MDLRFIALVESRETPEDGVRVSFPFAYNWDHHRLKLSGLRDESIQYVLEPAGRL
jgi:hypothetical protein